MTELHDKPTAPCSIGALSVNEQDAALVRRVVDEIWNAGDVDLADELFASTYVNHGGLIPDLVEGPEGIKFSVALYRAAFPDFRIRVDTLSARNGTVQMRWTALNIEPGFSGAIRSSVAGGRIVESWTSWDSANAMRRLEVFLNDETS